MSHYLEQTQRRQIYHRVKRWTRARYSQNELYDSEIDRRWSSAGVALNHEANAIPPGGISQKFAICPPGIYTCESKIERVFPLSASHNGTARVLL
jgi:hypothetical protein